MIKLLTFYTIILESSLFIVLNLPLNLLSSSNTFMA